MTIPPRRFEYFALFLKYSGSGLNNNDGGIANDSENQAAKIPASGFFYSEDYSGVKPRMNANRH
jgi:hypothetical protein